MNRKTWTHDALLRDLSEHLQRPERMMWMDMPIEDSGSCRPDILTINKSFTKPAPLIYEVKASVSDFRSDTTSGKWQKYQSYACAVIFAVPKGLVTKDDLPAGCGLIVRHPKCWRTAKAPTLNPMPDIPMKTWLKLLMSSHNRADSAVRIASEKAYFDRYSARQQFADDVRLCLSDMEIARRQIEALNADHARQKELMDKKIERDRDRILESVKSKERAINETIQQLQDQLGINITNTWNVKHEIQKLIDRCDANHEVTRLREVIKNLQSSLQADLDGGVTL